MNSRAGLGGASRSRAAVVVLALLSALGCTPRPSDAQRDQQQLQRSPRQREAELDAARQVARDPMPEAKAPTARAQGVPIAVDGRAADALEFRSDKDCPAGARTSIRAERGRSCDTYQAEVTSWMERCVEQCDENDIADRVLRQAMAACSAWCSSKHCHRATFIPPDDVCTMGDCFRSALRCPDDDCPLFEYCTFPDVNRVWNCFCRDLIPT